ncbi:hypothetical protein NQ318_005174 [Aromia moschata]|uniref:Uncharacterized protein n=1 Tax=Aromia moschata TaxID=1265417 RepID=A0AAV8XI99_9CUCU|nr:hypothetical protein NQ318_005174 [Aromia moschata]
MRYWNYPSEEVSNALETVDLRNCPEQRISAADRSICARPRTLMLPIGRNNAVKKYLLSADDCISLEEWDMELNDVLCSLRLKHKEVEVMIAT